MFSHRTGGSLKAPGYLVLAMAGGQKLPYVTGEAVTHHSFLGK